MLRSITQLCWPLACLGLLVLLLQMSAYECREWSPKTDEEKSLTGMTVGNIFFVLLQIFCQKFAEFENQNIKYRTSNSRVF